jgi:hypothetical protein
MANKGSRNWSEIFRWVLEEINALPYRPGLRWAFYRSMEKFQLSKPDWNPFKDNLARRRKNFADGWAPDTLSDTVRTVSFHGYGPESWDEYKEYLIQQAPKAGFWRDPELSQYVECWFEAEAMTQQFEHYLGEPYQITLRPFRGDYTLSPKWNVAQDLKAMAGLGKRIVILYFGDADFKGSQIPFSALRDIEAWSGVKPDFVVGGLTTAQAEHLGLPENFERPGQWQWEAMSDLQARHIVLQTLNENVEITELRAAIEGAEMKRQKWLTSTAEALTSSNRPT